MTEAEYPSKEEILKAIFDAVYAQYPKKRWQGLTDFELKDIRTLCDYSQYESAGEWAYRVQLATEQALKEKNVGAS